MNKSTVLFLVNDSLKAVEVAYDESGQNKKTIKKTFRDDLKVGDYVLAETNTRWNAAVCKITRINVQIDFESAEPVGWVFATVDMNQLDSLRKLEEEALLIIEEADRRKRKAEMRKTVMENCGNELAALTGKLLDYKP